MEIIREKCIRCRKCVRACSYGAIDFSDNEVQINSEKCVLCKACQSVCPVDAISFTDSGDVFLKGEDTSRGVYVYCEAEDSHLSAVSLELLGKGREIADSMNQSLTAVLLGNHLEDVIQDLCFLDIDQIVCCSHQALEVYTAEAFTNTMEWVIREQLREMPRVLLIGASLSGRDMAARLAARLRTGLTADCTELEVDKESGLLLQTRPAYGGNLLATIQCQYTRPQIATVRAGVMSPLVKKNVSACSVMSLTPPDKLFKMKTHVLENRLIEVSQTSIQESEIIVAGGMGIKDEKGVALLKRLAQKLGGVVGASRSAVESGLFEKNQQIGQTGSTVKPKLYIACGISGAIQHQVGMSGAECIIAINKDRNAPIFDIADYGICGDVFEVLTELIRIL